MNFARLSLSPHAPAWRRTALALALAAPLAAFADAAPADVATPVAEAPHIRPLAGVLVTGTVSNGQTAFSNPDGSDVTGNLGGRYEALAGAEFPIDPNGLALRLTLGIHTTSVKSRQSERFTRFPLEATLWYPLNDKLRVGAGARYATRMRFSGAGRNTSDNLAATPGLLLVADYKLVPHLALDLRYAYERYERNGGGSDIDGSHFGMGLTASY